MRHLYQQIFVTIVGTAVLCGGLAVLAASVLHPRDHMPPIVYDTARYLASDLPEDPRALRHELRRRGRRSHMALALWSRQGRLLAKAGPDLPAPEAGRKAAYWFSTRRHVGVVMPLEDGRTLVVAQRHRRHGPGLWGFLAALGLLFSFLLLGSYWAARRITRRLETLGEGVQRLGSGDLNVQVDVQGQDEVAALARQFNATSERITGLLEQQRRVLAGASHELRSPMARLRMGLELLAPPEGPSAARRARLVQECERDIEELDVLVDDILLGARLRDEQAERRFSPVDLAALLQEEATRAGAQVEVAPCMLEGEARALRSLVRNLLDNARRHGKPPIQLRLVQNTECVVVSVEDQGEPIDEAERGRLFEPFFRPTGRPEGQGGNGLGLSLVRDIARHHGGEVRYEVSDTGGSRFVVELRPRASR